MSVTIESLNALKEQLQQQKDLGMPIQSDLYSHLNEVFSRIMLHHQSDAFDLFEQVSCLVKRNNFKVGNLKSDEQVNIDSNVVTNKQAIDFISNYQRLVQSSSQVKTHKCVIGDFVEHGDMLEWAGVGFG